MVIFAEVLERCLSGDKITVENEKFRLQRRRFLQLSLAVPSIVGFSSRSTKSFATTQNAQASSKFQDLLSRFQSQVNLVQESRGYHEFAEFFPDLKLERAPIKSAPSKVEISIHATDLIMFCEVSSKLQYEKAYNYPTWPGGQSGPTIGIGYDLGYATKSDLNREWKDFIDTQTLLSLESLCGVIGTEAGKAVTSYTNVHIPWEKAKDQFINIEQPRYVGLTERSLPNFDRLPSECRGALVSLVYNRGPTFSVPVSKDPHRRYEEMRNIYVLMERKKYSKIPEQIRSMERLWKPIKNLQGLVTRRELEATLFESGKLP
jgi:GH24 family phage-related lysozyme (muramidase)